MPVPSSIFDEIYRIHGHRCPMSTLGGRLGLAARRHFAEVRPGEMAALYRARTCAVDGIAHATGCMPRVIEEGRHCLTLIAICSGEGVEVRLLPSALDIAGSYRLLRRDLERRRPHLSQWEIEAGEGERALDSLLADLRTRPDRDLLGIESISVDPETFLSEAFDA